MDVLTVLLSIIMVILITVFIKQLDRKRRRFVRLVNQIPGPPSYPLIGSTWEFLTMPVHRYIDIYEQRSKKYSPIFRGWVGSNVEVTLNDPDYVEIILSSTEYLSKSPFYNFLHPWLGEGLLTLSGKRWHELRKLITPTFHFNVLEDYVAIFSEQSDTLVEKIMANLDEGYFNIYPMIARCSLDIICETALGVKINCQNDNNSEYTAAVHNICDLVVARYTKPWLHYDFIFQRSDLGKRFKKCIDTLHGFTDRVIRERNVLPSGKLDETIESHNDYTFSEVRKKNADFLGMLLDAMREENTKLTNKELREMCDGVMFGGHDTTSLTVTWALQLLGEHTDIQEKVYEELEDIFQGSNRSPLWRDLQEMKYLERVIRETLRLYPPAPAIGREIKKDVTIGKYIVPAGVSVWIQFYFLHRNPKYFPNPEEFNPDNFLPEKVRDRHPYAFIPWSAGPRNCLGQKYALLEAKTLLSSVIRNFQVKSMKKTKNITPVYGITLAQHNGVHIAVKLRERRTTK